MNITRQMIAAAHDVTMRHKIVLGHELLGEIYQAMKSASPAQRKPLTDEEIWKFWWARPEVPEGEDDSMEAEFVSAVRAVLAAHGIKGEA